MIIYRLKKIWASRHPPSAFQGRGSPLGGRRQDLLSMAGVEAVWSGCSSSLVEVEEVQWEAETRRQRDQALAACTNKLSHTQHEQEQELEQHSREAGPSRGGGGGGGGGGVVPGVGGGVLSTGPAVAVGREGEGAGPRVGPITAAGAHHGAGGRGAAARPAGLAALPAGLAPTATTTAAAAAAAPTGWLVVLVAAAGGL